MKSNIITIIPVYNGEGFIRETLESVARQTLRPDRVIVLDNCSTDKTPQIVQEFEGLKCEYMRNQTNLGLFGNCNRALDFAEETNYLLILHADDVLEPRYFEVMTSALNDCKGRGLGYCLDERVDESGRHLSFSGEATGSVEEIPVDTFLSWKAEIANQAFSGSLLKTNYQKAPCKFPMDMPILADMAMWAQWGSHCNKIVRVNQPLCKYRWHGDNTSSSEMPGIQALVLDEWRVMQMSERLRNGSSGPVRKFKLKGVFAVRTGVKAKRIHQQNNHTYSWEIVREGKKICGPLAWYMGQVVVETRDLILYRVLRRRRHPKNVYS